MANWCSNYIEINKQGDSDKFKSLSEFFSVKSEEYDRGHLPQDVEDKGCNRYFFEIDVHDSTEDSMTINLTTKWVPPIAELTYIGILYEVDIECSFEELACDVAGNFEYSHNERKVAITRLDSQELSLCHKQAIAHHKERDNPEFDEDSDDFPYEYYYDFIDDALKKASKEIYYIK